MDVVESSHFMARLLLIVAMMVCVSLAIPLRRGRATGEGNPAEHTRVDAEGGVGDVTCSGVEMRLKIAASNGTFRLHARDYTRVDISEDVPFQAGEFKPCTELDGKTAKITFVTVEHKSYDGEIQSIEVESEQRR
jgi:hypothetical protein